MRKLLFTLPAAILIFSAAFAQQEMSSFTVTGSGQASTMATDYMSIGINPSNLGWESEKRVRFGFLEIGASVYSDALQKDVVRENFLKSSSYEEGGLSMQEKREAAQLFAEKGLRLNADVNWFGISYQDQLLGGFAFSIRERASSAVLLNETFADILFNGRNAAYFDGQDVSGGDTSGVATNPRTLAEITDGSHIQFSWYREFNFSYGRKIWGDDETQLYAGAGVRYLMGYGIVNVDSRDGELTAYSSLSPVFSVDYGSTSPSIDTSGAFRPVGSGFGFDLGVSAIVNKKWKFAASVTNLGSINWTGNVYEVDDTALARMQSQGINSYNFIAESGNLVGEDGIFKWKGVRDITVALPSALRAGVNYSILENLQAGVDMYLPFTKTPGSLRKALVTAGGQVTLFESLKLSTGLSFGGGYGVNVPLGISFAPNDGSYEIGIASRDAFTFFTDKNPNLSVAFGFLRFGI